MHAILELINYFGIVINCIIICSPHISALVIWTPLPQGIGEGREGEGTFAWWVWKPMKFLDTRGKNIEQSSLGTQLNKPKFITMWSANKSNLNPLLIPLVGWESESVHSPHLPRERKLVNMSQLSLLFPAMTRVGVGMGEKGETDLNKTNKYFSFIHHHDLKYPSTATISAVFLIFSMHLSAPSGKALSLTLFWKGKWWMHRTQARFPLTQAACSSLLGGGWGRAGLKLNWGINICKEAVQIPLFGVKIKGVICSKTDTDCIVLKWSQNFFFWNNLWAFINPFTAKGKFD